jgi:hypothetical protein
MSESVQEIVSRFWASYQPREDEPSAAELVKTSEEARQSLELAPPSDCVEWWSALPEAVQQKWLADPKTPTMYGAWCERRKRQEAVNFARANVGLEGFKPSEDAEQRAARFIAGEIELADYVNPAR